MMTEALKSTLKPCPHCGEAPTTDVGAYAHDVTCTDCYDYATDTGATPATHAWGFTAKEAVANWNEMVEDYLDTQENAS